MLGHTGCGAVAAAMFWFREKIEVPSLDDYLIDRDRWHLSSLWN